MNDDVDSQAPEQEPTIETAPTAEPDRAPASAPVEPPEGTPSEPAPETGVEAFKAGQASKGITPDKGDWFKAVLEKASHNLPAGIPGFQSDDPGWMQRYLDESGREALSRQQGVAKIPYQEANEKYLIPGMTPFNEDVDPFVAQMRAADYKHQRDVEAWKDSGGTAPWTEAGIGMLAGLTDPVNILAMQLVGPAAKLVGLGGDGVLSVASQNAALNVALGAGQYIQEKRENANTSFLDSAEQAGLSTLAMTGLHFAATKLFGAFRSGVDEVRQMPPDVQQNAFKESMAQAEAGAKIDPTASTAEATARRNGELEGVNSPYRFQARGESPTGPMYSAKDAQGNSTNLHGLLLGPGETRVDNPAIANNHVANPGGESGQIGKWDGTIQTDKYINLDHPANSPELGKFMADTEEKLGVKLDIEEGETVKDIIGQIAEMVQDGDAPHDALAQVQEVAKSHGFEGYYGEGTTPNGEKFNYDHPFADLGQPSEVYKANPDITPQQSLDDRQATNAEMQTPRAGLDYTPETEKEIHDLKHGQPDNATPDGMVDTYQEQYESARQLLDKMAEDRPELKEELHETLDRENATDAQEKSVLSDFIDCLGGGT